MKGTNSLVLNQAQMVAAMQHFLDTVIFKDPGCAKVSLVKSEKEQDNGFRESSSFRIELVEPQAAGVPA